jgi:hypothetical protein
MAKSQHIRIRPFALPDTDKGTRGTAARLSIEVNGRILPLAKYVEIVGEILPERDSQWRRDVAPKT